MGVKVKAESSQVVSVSCGMKERERKDVQVERGRGIYKPSSSSESRCFKVLEANFSLTILEVSSMVRGGSADHESVIGIHSRRSSMGGGVRGLVASGYIAYWPNNSQLHSVQ